MLAGPLGSTQLISVRSATSESLAEAEEEVEDEADSASGAAASGFDSGEAIGETEAGSDGDGRTAGDSGAGSTVSLPLRIGRQRTAWLGLSGQRIDVQTALAWGLVDEVRLRQHLGPDVGSDTVDRNSA